MPDVSFTSLAAVTAAAFGSRLVLGLLPRVRPGWCPPRRSRPSPPASSAGRWPAPPPPGRSGWRPCPPPPYNEVVDVARRSRETGIALALAGPLVALVALLPLRGHVLNANLALILVLVVLGVAVAGGRTAGVVSALVAAVAYDLVLAPPYGSLAIARESDIETTVLLGLIGLIAGELVERARRSEAAAIARRRELERVRRRAELAAGGEPPGRLIALSTDELTDLLGLAACHYVPTAAPDDLPIFTHGSISIPGVVNNRLPEGAAALPVRAHGRDLGYFLLVFPTPSFGVDTPIDDKHAAVALADQLGLALLRFRRP